MGYLASMARVNQPPCGFSRGLNFQTLAKCGDRSASPGRFVARIYGQNVRKVSDFVEDFSELGDYLEAPVKTYSSGMMARLAFGLSMAIEFDCYLIDEVTAVGDARFQRRCQEAFAHRRKNADLIVVSHSIETIKSYCDRGGVLVDGRLIMFASVDQAIEMYNRMNR
jgi:capsular polysaccharide transport system ATP-binding protein